MHHLPIETDTYFNSYAQVPYRFSKFLIPSARYHFKTDGINASLDMNITLEGFSIWIHYLWLEGRTFLQPFNTKDTYALHFWLSRSMEAKLENKGNVDVEACILFFLKAMEHAAWPASGPSLSIHINVDPADIQRLSVTFPQLVLLKRFPSYNISTPVNPVPFAISAVSIRILKRILHCRHLNFTASCFLQRQCVSLYSNYLKELYTETGRILISNEDRWKLYRILQYAGSHPDQVRSYEGLADQFDIDFMTMKLGFEQEFHISLFDFVLQERMTLAFNWLMRYDLNEIARRLGYPATFLFNADFEMFYGRNPLQLQMTQ